MKFQNLSHIFHLFFLKLKKRYFVFVPSCLLYVLQWNQINWCPSHFLSPFYTKIECVRRKETLMLPSLGTQFAWRHSLEIVEVIEPTQGMVYVFPGTKFSWDLPGKLQVDWPFTFVRQPATFLCFVTFLRPVLRHAAISVFCLCLAARCEMREYCSSVAKWTMNPVIYVKRLAAVQCKILPNPTTQNAYICVMRICTDI